MRRKIVVDSSADMMALPGVDFSSVPLKIATSEREFVDDRELDVIGMMDYLAAYKDKSRTSCPNSAEYLAAFDGADEVFCVTITRNLSGSHAAALVAAEQYMKENAGKRVFVVDTLSAGAECALIAEKLGELVLSEKSFDEIVADINEYKSKTHLIFALQSLHNLAANGRVSPLAAKISGVLGIRVIGKASDMGTLEVTDKVRGAKNAITAIYKNMRALGYSGGKVIINGADAEEFVSQIASLIRADFPEASVKVGKTGGLCSFYAERGGAMIGFETSVLAEFL